MTYRIHRSERPNTVIFILSGEMNIELVTRLQEVIAKDGPHLITLDLKDITTADREAVRFLVGAEATGIRIINCPEYMRSWIAEEKKVGAKALS